MLRLKPIRKNKTIIVKINFLGNVMKTFYLVMCILGTILPLSQFIPWLINNGIDIPLMFNQIATNKLSSFAWLDVVISALVLIGFIVWDSRTHQIKHAWYSILGTCTVGVSLGLPLYLLTREVQKSSKQ